MLKDFYVKYEGMGVFPDGKNLGVFGLGPAQGENFVEAAKSREMEVIESIQVRNSGVEFHEGLVIENLSSPVDEVYRGGVAR